MAHSQATGSPAEAQADSEASQGSSGSYFNQYTNTFHLQFSSHSRGQTQGTEFSYEGRLLGNQGQSPTESRNSERPRGATGRPGGTPTSASWSQAAQGDGQRGQRLRDFPGGSGHWGQRLDSQQGEDREEGAPPPAHFSFSPRPSPPAGEPSSPQLSPRRTLSEDTPVSSAGNPLFPADSNEDLFLDDLSLLGPDFPEEDFLLPGLDFQLPGVSLGPDLGDGKHNQPAVGLDASISDLFQAIESLDSPSPRNTSPRESRNGTIPEMVPSKRETRSSQEGTGRSIRLPQPQEEDGVKPKKARRGGSRAFPTRVKPNSESDLFRGIGLAGITTTPAPGDCFLKGNLGLKSTSEGQGVRLRKRIHETDPEPTTQEVGLSGGSPPKPTTQEVGLPGGPPPASTRVSSSRPRGAPPAPHPAVLLRPLCGCMRLPASRHHPSCELREVAARHMKGVKGEKDWQRVVWNCALKRLGRHPKLPMDFEGGSVIQELRPVAEKVNETLTAGLSKAGYLLSHLPETAGFPIVVDLPPQTLVYNARNPSDPASHRFDSPLQIQVGGALNLVADM